MKAQDALPTRRPNFIHHLHPPTIPAKQARWRYTLGLGGLAVFLSLVLAITGALEMFYYIPTPEMAGSSIYIITYLVPYGKIVRHLHYWAAQALVIVAGLHLLRVVFTGAYARRFNYLLGMVLFSLAIGLDFSGYMLRWDEGIRWAMVAGTNLIKTIPFVGEWLYFLTVGGDQLGAAALNRFYTWHIFGLTLLMAGILIWHIFKVRRDGGIAVPPVEDCTIRERVTRFELVRREGVAVLLASAVLLLMAAFLPAPLATPMKTALQVNTDNRAPWFFLWIQQLLRWGDPFWLGVVIPLILLALTSFLPYLLPAPPPEALGRWFPRGGRLAQFVAVVLCLGLLVLTILSMPSPTP